jgi:hypothetical protein
VVERPRPFIEGTRKLACTAKYIKGGMRSKTTYALNHLRVLTPQTKRGDVAATEANMMNPRRAGMMVGPRRERDRRHTEHEFEKESEGRMRMIFPKLPRIMVQ